MTALAALALLAAAAPQGTVGPIKIPPGPIAVPKYFALNLIGNPGFESSALAPWTTGGTVKYWDKSPDGSSAQLVGQSIQGLVTNGNSNTGNKGFRMNAEYPAYVIPGAGVSAATYVQQSLSTPVLGGLIANASVWTMADSSTGMTVEIEYTAGLPSTGNRPLGEMGWQKWDFRSSIDPARVVKAIRFRATAYSNGPGGSGPAFIDDANVSILTRI